MYDPYSNYGVGVVILFPTLIEVTFSYTNLHGGGHRGFLENLGFNGETTNTASIKPQASIISKSSGRE